MVQSRLSRVRIVRLLSMNIFFLGWTAQYEQQFIKYLAEGYSVKHLPEPKKLNRARRVVARALGRLYPQGLFGKAYCRTMNFAADDLLICNEGQIHRKTNPEIIRAFPGKKVLLIRDLVDKAFISEWSPNFDAVYSFDRRQCEQLGVEYLNQFMPMGYRESAVYGKAHTGDKASKAPTALFIGREKGRGAALIALADRLKACGCEVDFRIFVDAMPHNPSPYYITELVDYRASLSATYQADILVEINQQGQAGFTLRTLEAAYFGKKLITNNQAIQDSPLYHPSNVLVLENDQLPDPEALQQFLANDFVPVAKEIIYQHSPDFMLDSLIARHGTGQ